MPKNIEGQRETGRKIRPFIGDVALRKEFIFVQYNEPPTPPQPRGLLDDDAIRPPDVDTTRIDALRIRVNQVAANLTGLIDRAIEVNLDVTDSSRNLVAEPELVGV
jgi:hypothetical protein